MTEHRQLDTQQMGHGATDEATEEVCYTTPDCNFDYCVKHPDYQALEVDASSAQGNNNSTGTIHDIKRHNLV